MLRVSSFNPLRFRESSLENNLEYILLVRLKQLCHIYSVHDPHIVALEDSLPIEMNSSICVQPIEGKYMLGAMLGRGNSR